MPPKKPSTYMGFIEAAILAQKEAEGSSRQAMTKYILANFGKNDAASFKRALKKGVSSGKLVANGARFKLAGVDFEPAQVDRVEIKDVSEGEGTAAESGDTVVMKCAHRAAPPHCFGRPFATCLDARHADTRANSTTGRSLIRAPASPSPSMQGR